jgi:hypothetical protein
MADTSRRPQAAAPAPAPVKGESASMLASVPPEVNTTLRGSAATSAATSPRASSTRRRAARPSAWTEDGLPTASSAAIMAARASSRSGAVAFQSR